MLLYNYIHYNDFTLGFIKVYLSSSLYYELDYVINFYITYLQHYESINVFG